MRILSSVEEEFPEVSIAEGGAALDGPTMLPTTSDAPSPSLSMPPLDPEQVVKFEAVVGVTADPESGETPESTPPVVIFGDIVPVDQLPEPIVVEPEGS